MGLRAGSRGSGAFTRLYVIGFTAADIIIPDSDNKFYNKADSRKNIRRESLHGGEKSRKEMKEKNFFLVKREQGRNGCQATFSFGRCASNCLAR